VRLVRKGGVIDKKVRLWIREEEECQEEKEARASRV
jgi:hypothetical protein